MILSLLDVEQWVDVAVDMRAGEQIAVREGIADLKELLHGHPDWLQDFAERHAEASCREHGVAFGGDRRRGLPSDLSAPNVIRKDVGRAAEAEFQEFEP